MFDAGKCADTLRGLQLPIVSTLNQQLMSTDSPDKTKTISWRSMNQPAEMNLGQFVIVNDAFDIEVIHLTYCLYKILIEVALKRTDLRLTSL